MIDTNSDLTLLLLDLCQYIAIPSEIKTPSINIVFPRKFKELEASRNTKKNITSNPIPRILVIPTAIFTYIGGEEEDILSIKEGTSTPQAQQFLEKAGMT